MSLTTRPEAARSGTGPAAVRRVGRRPALLRLGLAAMLAGGTRASPSRAADPAPAPLPEPTGRVVLTLRGAIAAGNRPGRADFDREMLLALGPRRISTPTAWTDGVKSFEGVLVRDVLTRVGAVGRVIRAQAVNDYQISIPREDFETYDVILALRMDGRDLTLRDKGPIWIVYPRGEHPELDDAQFNSRWVWQLRSLEVR